MELASAQPISQVTVADLAERARVTRATFYNHYTNPLDLLLQVLLGDLERAHHDEEERRARGGLSAAEILRLSIVDVVDHIERFKAVYQQAVHDPADGGVYEALVRHFADYALAFIARCTHPDLPCANHQRHRPVRRARVRRVHQGVAQRQLGRQRRAGRRGGRLRTCLVELIAGNPLRMHVLATVPTEPEPGSSATE